MREEGDDQAEGGHRVGQRDGEPEEGGVGAPPVAGLDQVEDGPQHHLQWTDRHLLLYIVCGLALYSYGQCEGSDESCVCVCWGILDTD